MFSLISRLRTALLVIATCLACPAAHAWGPEGHSIVAEIAQRRLTPAAQALVERALGRGASLASVASWADDVRDARPTTANLHFVNIPRGEAYEAARDCVPGPRGDCVVAALERLRVDLACPQGEGQLREGQLRETQLRDALRFAVHFVGDIHQPLHTIGDERGGNTLLVQVDWRGLACTGRCTPRRMESNFHVVWDSVLITSTVWNWGAYVSRLEEGWLREAPANAADGSPANWADETHAVGRKMWDAMPASRVLDDAYYQQALPVQDRQLAVAGLRLARYLNDVAARGARSCARP
jgi:hypothetical protein